MKSIRLYRTGKVGRHRVQRGHRGAVAVQAVICMVTLMGFMALTVDVGHMYGVRAELQRTADAAALAAAAALGEWGTADPKQAAGTAAQAFANANTVMGEGVTLDSSDLEFGSAYIDDETGKYVFTPDPGELYPNAVRVRVRRTEGSPSGPVSLYFANVFGVSSANLSAQATAVLTPRDISFVLDLSTSHNDDSSLRSYKNTAIDNRKVWEWLWDGNLADEQGVPQPVEDGLAAGPSFGNLGTWGDTVTDSDWDFAGDAGLTRLKRYQDWSLNAAWTSQTLSSEGYGNYTAAEMSAINNDAYDNSSSYYRRRVLVGLGIYRWKSGKSGGQSGGNGNNYIGSGELELMVPYPSVAENPDTFSKEIGGSWNEFVDYVRSSSSRMCKYDPNNQLYGDPGLQYRYGLKTFTDYLQEKEYGKTNSPGLAGSPQQPMGAVADAVLTSLDIIDDLQGGDLVGLASYATVGYGPSEKPDDMSWLRSFTDLDAIRDQVSNLQPGMWTTNTNVAQGIDRGVDVLLDSELARANAAKVLILLTDGIANQTRANPSYWNTYRAKQDAIQAAADARDQGVRIYTISVGANADQDLMKRIADPDYDPDDPSYEVPNSFHAGGSIASYQQKLEEIFKKLGGERPVILIE